MISPPTKFPTRHQIGVFANASGLQLKSTGSFPSTHTVTWSKHPGCFDAAERVQRAFQTLGYTVEINHCDSNAYGTGSLKFSLPMILDAAVRTGVKEAAENYDGIQYIHAEVYTDARNTVTRSFRFVIKMKPGFPGLGSRECFRAAAHVHSCVIHNTFNAYKPHVISEPTLSKDTDTITMVLCFSVRAAEAEVVEIKVKPAMSKK